MRLVLDLQAAQANNRTRGIGRYSLALAKAMAGLRGEHDIYLALNARFADTIAPLRAEFDALIPQDCIRVWHGTRDVAGPAHHAEWARQADELTREAFLAALKPDILHVGSIFEGFDDAAATSIGALGPGPKTAATLYDLIPLVHRDIYLRHDALRTWYQGKLQHLQHAGLWLAISEHSRREAIDLLGLPADKVVNISAAADAQFRRLNLSKAQAAEVRARYGVRESFVMYTGGIDHRKNIEGLLEAYTLLSSDVRAAHQLVIVCHASASARAGLEAKIERFGLPAGSVVLTGFVPDGDLVALYNLCTAFVFPSWHEGFGLPALEAMACGAPVIASDCSSLPEVIGRSDALFDPRDARSIAAKLTLVLQDADFRRSLSRHGPQQAAKFSWAESARRALAAFERWDDERKSKTRAPQPRRKLAMVAPLPPSRTGIAAYTAELLPALAEHYDIDVIVDQSKVTDAAVEAICNVRSVSWFAAHADDYDRIVYQFGNSHFHKHMFALLERHPGVVTLHDFYLSNALFHMETHGDAPACWTRALYESHGYAPLCERFDTQDMADVIETYPVNHHVLRHALGVVVHSQHATELARDWYAPEVSENWSVVPQVYGNTQSIERAAARRELGIPGGELVVCSFGIVAKTKLNHRLVEAWLASTLRENQSARLVFVGDHYGSEYGKDLEKTMRFAGTASRMLVTGFCTERDYALWLAAADIAVQLRTCSRGETSRAVLDCMNAGLPAIANAHGSMRDFPPLTLLPDEFQTAELVDAIERLASDPQQRQRIGVQARQHLRERHAPQHVAAKLADTVEHFYSSAAHGRQHLLSALSRLGAKQAPPGGWSKVAQAVAQSLQPMTPHRQVLVDASALVSNAQSSWQRSTLSQLIVGLVRQPAQARVEPVVQRGEATLVYARALTSRLLGLPAGLLSDEPVEHWHGDVYLAPGAGAEHAPSAFLKHFRLCGGMALQLIDDSDRAHAANDPRDHAADLALFDGAICRSRAAAIAWMEHVASLKQAPRRPYRVGFLLDAETRGHAGIAGPSDLQHRLLLDMLLDASHPHWLPASKSSKARRAVA